MPSLRTLRDQISRLAASRPAWRAVVAVAISAALILALVQAPCCDGAVAEGPATIETTATATLPAEAVAFDAAKLPPQKHSHPPAVHCDHCLAHVAFQPFVTMAAGRMEFASVKVMLPNDTAPASVAGLPLFKPPRA